MVEEELDRGEDRRQLVAREYGIEKEGPIYVKRSGGKMEVSKQFKGRTITHERNLTRVWLYEETLYGSGKFECKQGGRIPLDRSYAPERLWKEHKQMSREVVSRALSVCHETYVDYKKNPLEWIEGQQDGSKRLFLGQKTGTRCVLQCSPDEEGCLTLFIGFRGSKDKRDWRTNFMIELTEKEANSEAKVILFHFFNFTFLDHKQGCELKGCTWRTSLPVSVALLSWLSAFGLLGSVGKT